jgi:hypothetical protein
MDGSACGVMGRLVVLTSVPSVVAVRSVIRNCASEPWTSPLGPMVALMPAAESAARFASVSALPRSSRHFPSPACAALTAAGNSSAMGMRGWCVDDGAPEAKALEATGAPAGLSSFSATLRTIAMAVDVAFKVNSLVTSDTASARVSAGAPQASTNRSVHPYRVCGSSPAPVPLPALSAGGGDDALSVRFTRVDAAVGLGAALGFCDRDGSCSDHG